MLFLSRFLLPLLLLCLLSGKSAAVSIGDILLNSHLNEPLQAQVDLQLAPGEQVQDSCLSLTGADGAAISHLGNLPLNDIRLRYDAAQHLVRISSRLAFKEPYAVFQIKINCLQYGRIAKTLTALPDFGNGNSAPPAVAESLQPESALASSAPVAAMPLPVSAVMPVAPESVVRRKVKPKPPAALVLPRAAPVLPPFGLRLSLDPLELTRAPLSAETLEWLQAQHLLLGQDDVSAPLLNLQHELKRSKQQLAEVQLQLAAQSMPAQSAATPFTEALVKWLLVSMQQWSPFFLLIAAGLAGWLGYQQWKKRRVQAWNQEEERAPRISAFARLVPKTEATPPVRNVPDLETNETAVLEEGELYAIYGHADKGVKILLEFLSNNPNSEKVWLRLLSIYASQDDAPAFENSAKEFLKHNKNSKLWRMMQALGRTVDKDNPLYIDDSPLPLPLTQAASTSEEKQIGDVLVELGYLSQKNLDSSFAEFHAPTDGRFGNFLVMRRLITHAQLDKALFEQQSRTGKRAVLQHSALQDAPPMDLELDLPLLNPEQKGEAIKAEVFDFDWDFTQSHPKV